LALGGSIALAVGLAIEHTLHLACKVPGLLVSSVRSTVRREGLLVVSPGLALARQLCFGSSGDGSLEGLGSLFCSTLCLGLGSNSSLVVSLRRGVRTGRIKAIALALGQGAEGSGFESDLGGGGLDDFSGCVRELLVGLGLSFGGGLDSCLAFVGARAACR